jgi:hypothetical protein
MKTNVFGSADFATLQGGTDITASFNVENVQYLKLQNGTNVFMQVVDDKSNVLMNVPPFCVTTYRITEEVAKVWVNSKQSYPPYTPTGVTSDMWFTNLEMTFTDPGYENYKFM